MLNQSKLNLDKISLRFNDCFQFQGDMSDSFSRRRSSYNIEYVRAPKGGGSASKVSTQLVTSIPIDSFSFTRRRRL